jgi:sialic acid synthase SpsE
VDIPAGEAITASMIELKMPEAGIPADRFDRVLGLHARVHIPADKPILPDMLEP